MRLQKALEEKKFDLRMRDRLLAEGKITNAQVDEYLNNLADDSSNIEEKATQTNQETTKIE